MQSNLLLLSTALVAAGASAHIGLETPSAQAGAMYRATFQVGHGCSASATRQIAVTVPSGVLDARPMPKAGWSLEIQREKLAEPVERQGRTISERVARITWTARTPADALPSDQYDEFVLMAALPAQAGALAWPVSQACDSGRADWIEVPKPGQSPHGVKNPAPLLEVLPAAGNDHHHH
ncbi:YcnI family protein [Ramlibacter sp. MMS24-I3-19]|uniref:YcnI family copper-binding membrane protein n=1 Tax=Ramlibacter sp. MMS24-I3-19 TaxID=3416606 RepID=UPI003D02DE3C